MRELRTSIEIDAPPARVWSILVDFPAYAEWNPFMRSIEGEAHADAHLVVLLDGFGKKPRRIEAEVLRAQPEALLQWCGGLGVPGLFSGEHSFELVQLPGARTRFVHREQFRGALVPVVWRHLQSRARSAFEAMNLALKHRAESIDD